MDLFEEAQQKFRAGLSAQDHLLFAQRATADEVLLEVQSLEQQHRDRSRTLKLVQKVDPFIRGIEQYGNALGQFANAKPEILCLIWGSACIIIRLLRDFLDLFDKLTDMLQRLARQLGLFDLYTRLYPNSTRLRESLVEGYDAYLEFCLSVVKMLEGGSSKKNKWLKSGSVKLMMKALFKPVKQDFERVTSRLESLVDSIETEANTAEKVAAADHREVVNDHIDFKKYQDLVRWLDPVDTAATLVDLSDIHLPGTGQWLIGNEAFAKWFVNPASILWLHAKPGAGKTLLAYNLIKHLQQHVSDKSIVLYYFCEYRSVKSQQTRTVIQTLLADLCRQNNQVLEILEAKTRRYRKENITLSLRALTEMLIECLTQCQEVHVVIDALDESANRPELIQLLLSLQSKCQTASLFLISRDEFDIRSLLNHIDQIAVDTSDVSSDIDHFIQHTVKELIDNGGLKLRDKTLRETITQKLRERADGMFQYVKCQLDTLSQCISDKAIMTMLETLPSNLDQTYVRALERLKTTFPDTIDLIRWIFSCIVHATKPLSLAELSELVSFDARKGIFDFTAVPTDPLDLLRYSGGLFRYSDAKETLFLVHFSVKEFLEAERICETSVRDFYMGDDTIHLQMFRACLSYLLLPDFAHGQCFTERQMNLRIDRFALFEYVCCNWMKHYNKVSSDIGQDWERKVLSFLCHNDLRGNLVAWRQLWYYRAYSLSFPSVLQDVTLLGILPENPIVYAAESYCWPLTELLLREGFDVNRNRDNGMPPILEALLMGNPTHNRQRQVDWRYIRKLLEAGADPHATSPHGNGNVAFGIVLHGSPDDWNLLKELQFRAADFEVRNPRSTASTILQVIATHPSDPAEWLAYVLGLGVDVNEPDLWTGDGRRSSALDHSRGPPLQQSCFYGLHRCVRLLLDSGAEINHLKCDLGSPLQAATRSRNHALVKLLLDRHADVNQVGGSLGTPLQAAAWIGDEALVRLLLDHGANVNSTGGVLGNPLAAAIAKQHSSIIDLLLDRGADPGSPALLQLWKFESHTAEKDMELNTIILDGLKRTPLTWAISREDKAMVQKLLVKGAEVNFPLERCRINNNWNTVLTHPLCTAINAGNAEIIELIQQSSADTWIGAGCPLLTCIKSSNRDMLHMLRQIAVSSADASDIFLEALHQCRSDEFCSELTKVIDAQPVAPDLENLKCLWFNASTSSVKAKWLLSKGAIPYFCRCDHQSLGGYWCYGGTQNTPLITAIKHQDHGLVDILLQAGLDLNLYREGESSPPYSTPLLAAIYRKNHAVMERLLDLGASPAVDIGDHDCCNPFHRARDPESVDILLKHGVGVDDTCEFCPTALWDKVKNEDHELILHLVSKGADVNSLNFEGDSPLDYARRSHLDDTAELLEGLGGFEASEKARRAAQISSVLRISSHFKLVSSEETFAIAERRWVTLGRGLFLLGDYENSIIALERVFDAEKCGEGMYTSDVNCSGCDHYFESQVHHCLDIGGLGFCHDDCLAKHENEVNRVGSLKDHVYLTVPRPFFADCPAGSVALDETTHVTRNEWLDRVLAKWQPQADSAGGVSLVE